MQFNYNNLPEQLIEYDYYCIWGKKDVNKRTKFGKQEYKRPRSPKTLNSARTNHLEDFTDYFEAIESLEKNSDKYTGIGVVLADTGLCCIDIDDIDTQVKLDWVEKVVKWFDSYTEKSQSGNGVHIFFNVDFERAFTFDERQSFNDDYKTNTWINLKDGSKIKIEFYHTNHSINLTGNVYDNTFNSIRTIPEKDFRAFLNKHLKRDRQDVLNELPKNNKERIRAQKRIADIGKEGLLELIRNSSNHNDKKFIDLYDTGNWNNYKEYPSESEARCFIQHRLIHWTAFNYDLVEEIYTQSQLFLNSEWHTKRKFSDTQKEIAKAFKEHDPNDFYKAIANKDDSILIQFIKKEGVIVRYNTIKNKIDSIIPEGSSYKDIYPPQLAELLPLEITNRFNIKHPEDKLNSKEVKEQIRLMAFKNYYNPVQDYLLSVKWDQEDRFNELFEILHVTDTLDQTLIRKWFRQATQVAFNDTSNFDSIKKTEGVLIFSGPERIGKSSFWQRIVPDTNLVYISGDLFNAGNKDFKSYLVSHWIYCIDEIDESIQKSSKTTGSLKSIVTQDTITYRKPYAENDTQNIRLFSICGTTNKTDFIKNDIGERRWWVVQLKEKIDFEKLNKFCEKSNLNQFWAQAYYEGSQYGYALTELEKEELVNRVANKFSDRDYLEDLLLNKLDFNVPKENWNWFTTSSICESLEIEANFKSSVGKTLSELVRKGYIEYKNSHHISKYLIPPMKNLERIPESSSKDFIHEIEDSWDEDEENYIS